MNKPSVEFLNHVAAEGNQQPQQVNQYRFPNAQLKFVHDIRREELPVVDAVWPKPNRKGAL